ncbi:unnamed protein product, partial [Prorocentrum cordatum]
AMCSVCQHWEYVRYGSECCHKCGGAYLGGDYLDECGEPRESAQAGAAPVPPHLLRELEKWAVHYPALAAIAKDAAAPPPPRVPVYTDCDLDRMAALEQTALAKEVELATKQERLAAQEVQWRLKRYSKAKATLEEMQQHHVEAERNLELARQAAARAGRADETELRWAVGIIRAQVQRLPPIAPPSGCRCPIDDLRHWCQKHGRRFEYWEAVKQMEQSIAAPMGDISEVGESYFGDHHRDELDQLRKRSLEQALTEPERNQMETIPVKQAAQK